MQLRSIHPFPARMAPELALNSLADLPAGSTVLDPMSGSGTVLRQALSLGHNAIGFDMDPLAVLMSRVWTTPVNDAIIANEFTSVLADAQRIDLRSTTLPCQRDQETADFVRFWFYNPQRRDLTRLATALDRRKQARLDPAHRAAVDVLRVGLSRIIVTKEQCASLARDTSHSRPHRVTESSNYDVFAGFERSVNQLRKRLRDSPPVGNATIHEGDARALTLEDASVDVVMTSPPYLNAIDYMRGHRMSLVWLGYSIEELRQIRSSSIGADRASNLDTHSGHDVRSVISSMCDIGSLPLRSHKMIARYAQDLLGMTAQIARVLKRDGYATYVVGNSCLKGVFVSNSNGVAKAAELAGMRLVREHVRDLPANSRYLPMTIDGSLSKRMRTETVLTFQAAANTA
jgi:tRNA G10  N-methylase Trm11